MCGLWKPFAGFAKLNNMRCLTYENKIKVFKVYANKVFFLRMQQLRGAVVLSLESKVYKKYSLGSIPVPSSRKQSTKPPRRSGLFSEFFKDK